MARPVPTPAPSTERELVTPLHKLLTGTFLLAIVLCPLLAFGFYLAHFASYAKVYGALGTAVVLLTWLYLSSMVLILGGAINASFDRARRGEDVVPEDHES